MPYVKKVVNGALVNCTPADQTALAARDAAEWTSNPTPPALARTTSPPNEARSNPDR